MPLLLVVAVPVVLPIPSRNVVVPLLLVVAVPVVRPMPSRNVVEGCAAATKGAMASTPSADINMISNFMLLSHSHIASRLRGVPIKLHPRALIAVHRPFVHRCRLREMRCMLLSRLAPAWVLLLSAKLVLIGATVSAARGGVPRAPSDRSPDHIRVGPPQSNAGKRVVARTSTLPPPKPAERSRNRWSHKTLKPPLCVSARYRERGHEIYQQKPSTNKACPLHSS